MDGGIPPLPPSSLIYGCCIYASTTVLAYHSRYSGSISRLFPLLLPHVSPSDLSATTPSVQTHAVYAVQDALLLHATPHAALLAHPELPLALASALLAQMDDAAAPYAPFDAPLPMELQPRLAHVLAAIPDAVARVPDHLRAALPPTPATPGIVLFDLAPVVRDEGGVVVLEPALANQEHFLRSVWDTDAARARYKPPSYARRHPYIILLAFVGLVLIGLILYFLVLAPKYGFSLLGDDTKGHHVT